MKKMGELASELSELRRCGEILIDISRTLTEILSAEETNTEPEKSGPVPVSGGNAKPLTLIDVRKVMVEKSRGGYTKEVKALLAKYGSDNLSGLDPVHYAAILAEAEEIGND